MVTRGSVIRIVECSFVFLLLFAIYDALKDTARTDETKDIRELFGAKSNKAADLVSSRNYKHHFSLQDVVAGANISVNTCLSAPPTPTGFDSGLVGLCSFLNGQPGCCSADPTWPSDDFTVLCPLPDGISADQFVSRVNCRQKFVDFWCDMTCLSYSLSNMCGPQWNDMLTTCSAACPALTSGRLLSGLSFNSSNSSMTNCSTVGTDSSTAPSVAATLSTNSVSLPPSAYQAVNLVVTNCVNPPDVSNVLMTRNTTLWSSFPVSIFSWNTSSSSTWQTTRNIYLDVNSLFGQSQWTFGIVGFARSRGGNATSSPVTLTINVDQSQAPTSYPTVAVCSSGSTSGTFSFAPKTTSVTTATCDCGTQCTLSGVKTAFLIFQTFAITSAFAIIDMWLAITLVFNILFNTILSLTVGSFFNMRAGAIGNFNYAVSFSGPSSSTLQFDSGSTTYIRQACTFAGPAVIINGLLSVAAGGSVTVTSSSVTSGNSSEISLNDTTATWTHSSPAPHIATRTRITGRGRFFHTLGLIRFFFVFITVVFQVGPLSTSSALLAARRPAASPLTATCGLFSTSSIAIGGSGATLGVDMSCTAPSTVNAMVVSSLSIASGGVLWLYNVSSSSLPILVNGTFTWNSGGYVSVDQLTNPTTTPIVLLRYPGSSCTIPSGAVAEAFPSGQITAFQESGTGFCQLRVGQVVVSPSSTSPSSSPALVYTVTYTVLLNKDCSTFTAQNAASIISAAGVDISKITFSTTCASTLLSFTCQDITQAAANQNCASLDSRITNPSDPLYTSLGVLGSGTGSSSSNAGLFGLLALLAIPVILIIAAIAWYATRGPPTDAGKYTADNEPKEEPVAPGPSPAPAQQPMYVPASAPVVYGANTPSPYGTTPYSTPYGSTPYNYPPQPYLAGGTVQA